MARSKCSPTISIPKSLDPVGLKRPSDFIDKVIYLFWPGPGETVGYELPYDKLAGKLYFRPGEITLWSGASGHGKSQILSDSIAKWIQQGSRICIASLEMSGAQQKRRLPRSPWKRPSKSSVKGS